MKRINKLLVLLVGIFFAFLLSSCKHIYVYKEDKANAYLEEYYLYISNKKQGFQAIDLRTQSPLYINGHLNGFINYDYQNVPRTNENDLEYEMKKSNLFHQWMLKNIDKSEALFLIDLDGDIVRAEAQKLKAMGYKKIHIYLAGYESLIKYNQKIEIIKGTSSCDC